MHALREAEPLLPEGPHRGARRARPAEGREDQPDRLLDLRVGVQDNLVVLPVAEADRQGHLERATARLVEHTAAQAGAQHMKLRFRHRPLQAQEKPIVKSGGVVDAILIQDQRLGQGTDLQQAVPVGVVARQARHLQTQHDADLAQPHRGYQLLKAGAVDRRRGRPPTRPTGPDPRRRRRCAPAASPGQPPARGAPIGARCSPCSPSPAAVSFGGHRGRPAAVDGRP